MLISLNKRSSLGLDGHWFIYLWWKRSTSKEGRAKKIVLRDSASIADEIEKLIIVIYWGMVKIKWRRRTLRWNVLVNRKR